MLKLRGRRLDDGRWHTDSAERNKEALVDVLRRILPTQGRVLEIASGTGQHVVHFARHLPSTLTWQPSDPDPELRRSVSLNVELAGLANVAPPLDLDVARPWPALSADAVICINMVHVAPWAVTLAMLRATAGVLQHGAPLFLYGPYRRGGVHTSPSNHAFDEALRQENADWGLRDVEAITSAAEAAGFDAAEIVAMPSNNLSLVFRRRLGK